VILAACSIIRDRIAFRRKIERTKSQSDALVPAILGGLFVWVTQITVRRED